MGRKIFVGLLVGLSAFATLSAQAYSLEDCIAIAIRNNPNYKVQELQKDRAKLQIEVGRNEYLPTVQAGLGQSWDFGRSVDKTGVMSDRSSMSTSLSLSASTTLFDGFSRLHSIRAAKLQLEAATAGLAEARQNLGMQVVQAYYAAVHAGGVVRIAKSQAERSREQRLYAEDMYKAGRWSKDKVSDALATEAQSEQNVVQAENDEATTLLNLKHLMQVERISIEMPETDEVLSKARALLLELSGDAYLSRVLEISPSLRANQYSQEAAKENIKSARSGYYPRIALSLGYGNSYYKVLGDNYKPFNQPFSDQLRQNGRSYIGLNLSMPIFDAFRTRSQIRQAKLGLRELELTRTLKEVEIRKELETALLSARSAERKIDATKVSVEASLSAEKLAEESWRAGRTSSNELSQARNKSFIADIEHLNAKYDYLLRSELLRYYLREHQ